MLRTERSLMRAICGVQHKDRKRVHGLVRMFILCTHGAYTQTDITVTNLVISPKLMVAGFTSRFMILF